VGKLTGCKATQYDRPYSKENKATQYDRPYSKENNATQYDRPYSKENKALEDIIVGQSSTECQNLF
jgi:hypothetical protein